MSANFQVTEPSAGGFIVIADPSEPMQDGLDYLGQVVGRTSTGGWRIMQMAPFGTSDYFNKPIITWAQMPDADFTNFQNFWFNTAKLQTFAVSCNLANWDLGNMTNMRYISGMETFNKNPNGTWRGQLRLEKDWNL